jgi:hypothetical protein
MTTIQTEKGGATNQACALTLIELFISFSLKACHKS